MGSLDDGKPECRRSLDLYFDMSPLGSRRCTVHQSSAIVVLRRSSFAWTKGGSRERLPAPRTLLTGATWSDFG